MIGDYLKPLRRKVGVLTLMIACVFMVTWVRSELVFDLAGFYVPSNAVRSWSIHELRSLAGRLTWRMASGENAHEGASFRYMNHWDTVRIVSREADDLSFGVAFERRWKSFGLYVGTEIQPSPNQFRYVIVRIHYLLIAVPLTLLSAWLLLSDLQEYHGYAI